MSQPKKKSGQGELYFVRLEQLVNPEHELVVLAKRVKWERFEEKFSYFTARKGVLWTVADPPDGWAALS